MLRSVCRKWTASAVDEEIALPQGGTTKSVVRVGDTVRRPPSPRAEYVRSVFRLLEDRAVPAPRFRGTDASGRYILSYIDGDAAHGKSEWTDAQLVQVARLVRSMHDATTGSTLAGGAEVVCHNDLAPWNLILDGDTPVAFIDFDGAAPGRRVDDLAYLIWTFLGLGNGLPPGVQAGRMALVCRSYSLKSAVGLIDAIVAQQTRIEAFRRSLAENGTLNADTRSFNASRAAAIQAEMAWVRHHRDTLVTLL